MESSVESDTKLCSIFFNTILLDATLHSTSSNNGLMISLTSLKLALRLCNAKS